MKKKILKNLFLSVLFAGGFSTLAQASSTDIQLVNTGEMNVHGIMYVQGDMQMRSVPNRDVLVRHHGHTHLTGSFWQDAEGNVFEVINENWSNRALARGVTSSTGTIHFVDVDGAAPGIRRISPSDANLPAFNRADNYVAFPHLTIDTRDRIVVPERMGIDARTIRRTARPEDHTEGVMVLQSRIVNGLHWNASLRITSNVANNDPGITAATGNETRFVAPDAVIVEFDVWDFRETGQHVQGSHASHLIPFSPPYWHMRAGYFAGNWVRRPVFETNRNSVNAPLGNRSGPGLGGQIARDQHVIDVHECMGFQAHQTHFFTPTPITTLPATTGMGQINFREYGTRQAYLVRLLPQGEVGDQTHTLNVTYGHHNDEAIRKFVFDGRPFPSANITTHDDRQFFAGHPVLVQQPMTVTTNNFDGAQNWLAGNSFTSSLNTRAIADYLLDHDVELLAGEAIWIFQHGEVNYSRFALDANLPNVPAMGIFMIRAVNQSSSNEQLVIGPQFQIHAMPTGAFTPLAGDALAQSGLRSMQRSNSLTLALTPENNPAIFSRSEILLNENASLGTDNLDIIAGRDNPNMFQLSGTNNANVRLQRNALPHTAEVALLRIEPAASGMWVTLTALDVDNFSANAVLLYDRQTGDFIQDLRANNSYTFFLTSDADPNRFEVRFAPRNGTTDIEDTHIANWSIYNNRSQLTVTGLNHSLIGETMRIFNAAGVLQIQQPINGTVEYINIQDLPAGVYLITIQGRTERFVK